MSLPYNFQLTKDGSYHFISNQGYNYLIYFFESVLPDAEGNIHIVYNLGFSRDGKHNSVPFVNKFDSQISTTILFIVNDFFNKNDHKVLIYFCFGDDGYSRHRSIVFNKWSKELNTHIEKYDSKVKYENEMIYGSLMIVKDNPLKTLILEAFNTYIQDIKNDQ